MGFGGACGVGPSGYLGWGSLYIYIKDKPGKKMSARGGRRRKHRASTAKPSTMRVNRVRFGNFHNTNPIILGHICETWLA